ncbi:MAG TPA: acyl carrier protein [Rhodobacteraceae bacterium]|nr:acyl carrier protein [Paracoccaceae bacterium]
MKSEIVKKIVEREFLGALAQSGVDVEGEISAEIRLLDSGLDSLGFAILVTTLEDRLGYDPFTLMEEAVYPQTYGEFMNIYLKFSDHLSADVTA